MLRVLFFVTLLALYSLNLGAGGKKEVNSEQ